MVDMHQDPRIRLDPDDPTPAFEQIRRQIVDHVVSGRLPVGTRLPALRQLARDLGIAVGTAAHAYRELEQAGVISTRRGAGTRISGIPATPERTPPIDERLRSLAETYVSDAAGLGAQPTDIIDAVLTEVRRRK